MPPMECVPFEVTLISAQDLDDTEYACGFSFSSSSPMEVYALVYVVNGDDVYAMQTAPPDAAGGSNPEWGFTARFVVPRDGGHPQTLHVSLRCRSPCGDEGVGNVVVSIEELLRLASQSLGVAPCGAKFLVSRPLTTPSGRRRGILHFAFRYGEMAGAAAAAARGRKLGPLPVAECPSEWTPALVPQDSAPSLLLAECGACPPERRLWRLRNRIELVAWLSTGLLLRRLLCVGHLVLRPLPPPPPPGLLVCGYPPMPPSKLPPAGIITFHWPALLLLSGVLAAVHAHHARGLH